MNTPIFTRAKLSTKTKALNRKNLVYVIWIFVLLTADLLWQTQAHAEWKLDLSRRQKGVRSQDMNEDHKKSPEDQKGLVDMIFDSSEPLQEIVILSTEKGFVPNTIRVRKGSKYTIHVVNVNEKEKNISFVLDAFSEHHATYFGKIKSFHLEPKKEGIYSFQSPETSAEGRLIVFAAPGVNNLRAPAGEENK